MFSDDLLCLRSWHRTNQGHDSLCHVIFQKYGLLTEGTLQPLQQFSDDSIREFSRVSGTVKKRPFNKPVITQQCTATEQKTTVTLITGGRTVTACTVHHTQSSLAVPNLTVHRTQSSPHLTTHTSSASIQTVSLTQRVRLTD